MSRTSIGEGHVGGGGAEGGSGAEGSAGGGERIPESGAVGSVPSASAWNMTVLIAFRVVQGLGGGAIANATLASRLPGSERLDDFAPGPVSEPVRHAVMGAVDHVFVAAAVAAGLAEAATPARLRDIRPLH